jgi:hypothetical protein
MHRNGSLNCIIINSYLLIASPYRIKKHLKESGGSLSSTSQNFLLHKPSLRNLKSILQPSRRQEIAECVGTTRTTTFTAEIIGTFNGNPLSVLEMGLPRVVAGSKE